MDHPHAQLTLSTGDAALLDEVLASVLKEMRFELARTDDHAYRTEVHRRLTQLESIAKHVSELRGDMEVQAPKSAQVSPQAPR